MSLSESDLALYRPAVGIMLLNREAKIFVGRRIDMPAGLAAWQMPQGGIDPGETPREAALRELKEETGTDKALILGESRGGRYRGQRQKWFAMRFTGEDGDIDPAAAEHPEFDAWEWVAPELVPELIVPFKRPLYRDILAEFREHYETGRR
jgi:putative (di)nucleoside polyphosphate hydrolase